MIAKRLDGSYILCMSVFFIAAFVAWILAGKYSGGDESAKKIALYVAIPVFIIYFIASTFLYLNKSDEAGSVLLIRIVPGFSLIFICLSVSLPVFFMYPLSSNTGLFLTFFALSIFTFVTLYTIGIFKINFSRYLKLTIGMASKTGSINERDLFSLLPDKFFLFDKIHIFIGLLMLASLLAGFNLRNVFPAFSSVAISVPLFIMVCFLFQHCLAYIAFAILIKNAQKETNTLYILSK